MRTPLPLPAFVLPLLLVLPLLAGCDGAKPESPAPASGPTPAAGPLLAKDVEGTLPVLDAKKKDVGAEVAVVGRVREYAKGVFQLVDDKFDYCGRGVSTMDSCATPWDYCCIDQDEVMEGTLVVKALGADGKPVPKADLGIRELDLVAVKGTLQKEADGTLVLLAKDGWFRRDRPKVPDNVKFP